MMTLPSLAWKVSTPSEAGAQVGGPARRWRRSGVSQLCLWLNGKSWRPLEGRRVLLPDMKVLYVFSSLLLHGFGLPVGVNAE